MAADLARMLDATRVSLLIAKFSGSAVVRMSHVAPSGHIDGDHNERAESLSLQDSVYERVLFDQDLHIGRADTGWDVVVPVTERGDAIGILELRLPNHPDPDVVTYLESAAHALAYVLAASRRHTDLSVKHLLHQHSFSMESHTNRDRKRATTDPIAYAFLASVRSR